MSAGQNDNELISKVLHGDHQAYAGLVHRYQNYVFTLTLRLVKNREEAEEVAQDVSRPINISPISGGMRNSVPGSIRS